mgnify:CR=1 FL=1|jgi:hypothetical protein|tara:strand:- start:36 stop:356 length:321 start_codon:yes stop_codon:yes gene_type:complete
MKLDDLFASLKLEFAKDQRGLTKPKPRELKRSSVSYDAATGDKIADLQERARIATGNRPSASQLFSALIDVALPSKPTKPATKAKRKAKPSSKDNLAAEIRRHAGS